LYELPVPLDVGLVDGGGRYPGSAASSAINAGCYSRGSASSADEVRERITNFARSGLYPVG
jgi:hypothetical protein